MCKFVTLISFTEKGIAHLQESPARAGLFDAVIREAGGKVHQLLWTEGRYDGVVIFEMPSEAKASAILLKLAQQGYVRTETLHAYDKDQFARILAGL